MKTIKKKFNIPLYECDLTIIQGSNIKKESDRYGIDIDAGFEALVFKERKKGYSIVMIFEDGTTPEIIAHESLHVVTYVFDRCCMTISNNNDESAAYLLGWVVEKCHKVLKLKQKL